MNCVIVDDEPLAVQLLEQYVARLSDLDLVGSFLSPLEALREIRSLKPNIIFMDIQMPELSGIDLAKMTLTESEIIFTTAYRDYAVEGFELNACDYLVKPIAFTRFFEAVQRAEVKLKERVERSTAEDIPEYIFIKHEHTHVRVNLSDIIYLKGQGDYVELRTHERRWMTLEHLKDFEKSLPPDRFMRVHKSYIIHIEKIISVERNRIHMPEAIIPLSASYQEAFKQRFLRK